jgi:hypothetical protein
MMAGPDTPEGEKLDVMVTLIAAYEVKHFPMDLPDPVEAIKFEMERKGLTVKDLEPMIGKSNRVYEILSSLKISKKIQQDSKYKSDRPLALLTYQSLPDIACQCRSLPLDCKRAIFSI